MEIKNKKAETNTMSWIISIILLSGVIALLVLLPQTLSNNYNVDGITSDEFSNNFNTFDENTQTAQNMWESVNNDEGLSTIGSLELLFSSTVGIIKLILSSVITTTTQMFSFTEYFGVPSQVGFIFFTILLSILSVFIVFKIINSLNRRDL